MTPSHQLRLVKIETNGFYQENLGHAQLFDHYHRFFFSINLTKLESCIDRISNNIPEIKKKTTDAYSLQHFYALETEFENLRNTLDKVLHFRIKRGLINIAGKAIKFITGNLDNDDLEQLNSNIQALNDSEKEANTKIGQLTSFAGHIAKRYDEDIAKINKNIDNTVRILNTVMSEIQTIQLLNTEIINVMRVRDFIEKIERTINLARLETPNLELLTASELTEMITYLQKLYNPTQIMKIDDTHLFEILDQSKSFLVITADAVINVLKIPILQSLTYERSAVYPVPNAKNQILIPPAQFYLVHQQSEKWTDDCREFRNRSICYNIKKNCQCRLQTPKSCRSAVVTNNYAAIVQLRNTALLLTTRAPMEIIENCDYGVQKTTIKSNYVIKSQCDIIIGESTYRRPGLNFTIDVSNITEVQLNQTHQVKLKMEHLQDLQQLHQDVSELEEESIAFHPVFHFTHYAVTGSVVLIVLIVSCVLCRFRKNLYKNLFKKRRVVTLTELRSLHPNLNEVVQK